MNPPKCKDCRYWVERPSTPVIGLCHRYPPDSHYDSFPATAPDEWCGEFQMNSEAYARFSKEHPMMIEGPMP